MWFKRQPDILIGGHEAPYLRRWHIIKRNAWFNIYLHNMLRNDDDRAPHDHPFASLSVCLKGQLREHRPGHEPRLIGAGRVVYRSATFQHRLDVVRPAWTIFITGPRIREWGFWCEEKRFVHWREFTAPSDKGQVGRGCE